LNAIEASIDVSYEVLVTSYKQLKKIKHVIIDADFFVLEENA